jgi:hypothetical protein
VQNNNTSEINHRINMGNKCYYGLRNIQQSDLTQKDTKCTIYIMLIRPMVFYGRESWILKQTDEGKFSILERRILRNIYGPTCVNGVWRIKYDDDDDDDDILYSFYKEPSRV